MTIKRVDPISCARIVGALYAVLGLLLGAMLSVFAIVVAVLPDTQGALSANPMAALVGPVMAAAAIVVCPIVYGAMGCVFSLIAAWSYNFAASKIGGVRIEVG